MRKSLIDKWGLRDFVNIMKQKLSGQSEARKYTAQASSAPSSMNLVRDSKETPKEYVARLQAEFKAGGKTDPDVLMKFLNLMKDKVGEEGDTAMQARADLCLLTLPQCIGGITGEEPTFTVNHELCKMWAFTCGHMLGLLAGLAVDGEHITKAIDEVCAEAKRSALDLHKAFEKDKTRANNSKPKVDPKEKMRADSKKQSEEMIADLEKQASEETDPAAAAALRSMAESIRISMKAA